MTSPTLVCEHTDEILLELGLTYDEIIKHKVSGAVL
jgi:hypothetical protein